MYNSTDKDYLQAWGKVKQIWRGFNNIKRLIKKKGLTTVCLTILYTPVKSYVVKWP